MVNRNPRRAGPVRATLHHSVWLLGWACAAHAATVDRYQATLGDVTLEISAPRADIIRVRAGSERLPEDASWAVPSAIRADHTALELARSGSMIELRTAAARVRLDPSTLRLTVTDAAGRIVLEDSPSRSLEFTRSAGGESVELRKVMPLDAHYFGLGDKAGPLDRRGEAFTLWNTDAYGFAESSDPLYKSVPFVLGAFESGGAMGLLFDNTWRSHFDFGRMRRDTLSFGADGGPVDYYVMVDATPKAVVEAYAHLTGTAELPPLWALGFQQSKYSYASDAEVRAVANRLRADRIPSDVIYLDIDYQDRNRPFTVDVRAFPDLPRLIADLKSMGFRVVLITDLHVAHAPEQGYAPYDSGEAGHVFLTRPDGTDYVADVWPGPSVFPDFSRPTVRQWWGGLYAGFRAAGAAGFWNDMNEPAIFDVPGKTMPLDVVHRIEEPGFAPRSATHAEMHNVYGMLNSRATHEGLGALAPDARPFVLTRASYAGGQRYAATWTGDNSSSWNHLRLATSMLVNLGLSGFGLVGDDIGGFAGAGPGADLLTRWLEVGAFNPIFRDHAAKGKPPQEPWAGGAEHEAIRRRYIEERYRLLPYVYSLAEELSRTGMPIMRPVFLEYPAVLAKGDRLGGTADEFMLGPDLLIAPAPEAESPVPYTVSLPAAGWYDYWTGLPLTAATLSETPQLDRLPVLVRPGAIIPRQPLVQYTGQVPDGVLELAVYPGPDCRGQLYLDDGVSMAYRSGVFLRQTVHCQAIAGATALEFDARQGRYAPWWRELEVVVHGVERPPGVVRLGGRRIAANYDASQQLLRLRIPDQRGPARLIIDAGP